MASSAGPRDDRGSRRIWPPVDSPQNWPPQFIMTTRELTRISRAMDDYIASHNQCSQYYRSCWDSLGRDWFATWKPEIRIRADHPQEPVSRSNGEGGGPAV